MNQKEKDTAVAAVGVRVAAAKLAIVGDFDPSTEDEAVFAIRTTQAALGTLAVDNLEALIGSEVIEKEWGETLLKAQRVINDGITQGINAQFARDGYEK